MQSDMSSEGLPLGPAPAEPDRHLLGASRVTAATLAFRPTGVLAKALAADALRIVCWRGLIGGLLVVASVGWRGRAEPLRRRFHLGWRGWLLACIGSLASIAFIYAFKLTYVANV